MLETRISFSARLDERRLESIGKDLFERMRAAMVKGLSRASDVIVGELRRQSGYGLLLHRRTGILARSWAHGEADPADFEPTITITAHAKDAPPGGGIEVGSPVPYAGIHESGGTIKAKAGGMLTIPMGKNLTAGGVPRYPSVQALRDAMGAKNVFYERRGAGQAPLVVVKEGKKVNAYFALKSQVTIPARHYISIALHNSKDSAPRAAQEAFNDAAGR